MDRAEALKELKKRLDEIIDSAPMGNLDEPPRYQITGEIIPEELRGYEPKEEE